MQVAQVGDKVELIMHGGYKIVIYLLIINISQIQELADLAQQIIAPLPWGLMMKVKMLIILGVALH